MKALKFAVAAGVACAGFALPAAAQSDPAWYGGGSMGKGRLERGCGNFPSGAGITCSNGDTSWRVFGGYQMSRHVAAELGFLHGGTTLQATGLPGTVKFDSTAFDLSALGSLPINDAFSVYGRLGGYTAKSNLSSDTAAVPQAVETKTGFTYGAGLRYDFNRNVAVRGDWQKYRRIGGGQIGTDDLDVISLGVLYLFR